MTRAPWGRAGSLSNPGLPWRLFLPLRFQTQEPGSTGPPSLKGSRVQFSLTWGGLRFMSP